MNYIMSVEGDTVARLKPSLFWLVAPASLALWLLVAMPSRWLGFDTGATGAGLLLVLAWVGFWIAGRTPDDPDAAASPGEQQRWIALAFTIGIGAWMVSKAEVFIAARSVADLQGIGRPIGVLVVGWIIFDALLRARARGRVQRDERDEAVVHAADSASHTTLAIAVFAVAITLGFTPPDRLGWASPIALANLLVFTLVLSSAAGHVIAILRYRRDRA